MFLIERLIGVSTYSVILVLVCFILIGKKGRSIKRILFLYSIILSILAFNFIPYETADLYRIYEYVEIFKKYTFNDFLYQLETNPNFRIYNLLYWAIAKTGITQLLPAIVSFICYNCIFYIFRKTAEKNNISGENIAITLFFYMSIGTYMFVISGIRCMLGISLMAFCYYRENVERKFNLLHILLYLIAASIHSFTVVLIFIRFVICIFDDKANLWQKLLYVICLLIGAAFALQYLGSFIETILEKANSYLEGNFYSYIWEYVIGVLVVFVAICTLFKKKTILTSSKIKLNIWVLFEIILSVLAVCLSFEFTIFHRLATYIMPIILVPLMMTALQAEDNRIKDNKSGLNQLTKVPLNLKTVTIFISVLLLLVACSRGSLCSFKFFIL